MTDSSPEKSTGLRGIVRHSAIYSAAPILRQLISVGMHRLYTGWLGTAGIGVKEAVDLWAIALQQLLGFNTLGAMVRFFFDHKEEERRAKVVTSCTILLAIVAWTVCGLALYFSDWLAPLMLGRGEEIGDAELLQILQLTLLLIPFQLSTLSGLHYLMILKRSALFTSIQTVKLVLEVGLNFLLIGAWGLGVRGFLMSMLISEALTSLLLCGWMLVKLRPRVDWGVMRPIVAYAAPLIPVGVCQLMIHQVDRRLLLEFAGQDLTGIYGHGYKISYLVTAMMLGPFFQIWQPAVFGVRDARERARLVARGTTYGVFAIAAVTLGVILYGRQAAILLGAKPEFWKAYTVIPLVAGGYVFWALYYLSQMPLLIAKRTGKLLSINALAALVNVGLNLWLIPLWGINGAAITTCLTFVMLAGLGMLVSRSEAHVPFELGRLVGIVCCVVLGGAFALWMDGLDERSVCSILTALASKSAVLIALLALLWSTILNPEERSSFIAWLGERRWARKRR